MKHFGHHISSVLLVMMAMLTSCRQELCYNHFRSVDLSLSWEYEWERNYGMNYAANWNASRYGFTYDELRPKKPEWVNLITFSNGKPKDETYLTPNGGDVVVEEGNGQSFLMYNGDTEYIILSDLASATNARASATGRSRASLSYVSKVHPNTRTTNPPDVLFAAYIENVPEVEMHERKHITVKMQPLVYTYIIQYEFEYGKEHIALAHGALGGMAGSVFLRNGHTSEESTIILYDCELTDYGCMACVRSFGVPGFPDEYYGRADGTTAERPYTLNLEVRLKNGKYVEFNYDITEQMAKQPRGGVIRVEGLRIEDEQGLTSAGFNVDISDWGDHVDIDLPVNPKK